VKELYREWMTHRDMEEVGYHSFVKLICDDCGYRWADYVKATPPPCPRCGSYEVYEYETISVG